MSAGRPETLQNGLGGTLTQMFAVIMTQVLRLRRRAEDCFISAADFTAGKGTFFLRRGCYFNKTYHHF